MTFQPPDGFEHGTPRLGIQLNPTTIKNYILEKKNLEEKIVQNDLHKKGTLLKNGRLSARLIFNVQIKEGRD